MRPHPRRLFGFDGLRAVAALTVLAYHVSLAAALSRHGLLAPFFSALKAGVGVFFVISGTVLYLPYARAIRAGRPLPDWREFARRRAVRILPAYWLALTVLALGPFDSGVFTSDAWRYYGLGQIYSQSTYSGGLGVAWSLCVEVSFYVLLPGFAAAMAYLVARRRSAPGWRAQLWVLGAIGASTLTLRLLAAHSLISAVPQSSGELARSLPGLADWFAIGMAFAALRAEWDGGEHSGSAVRRLAARPAVCWLAAAAWFALGAALQPRDLYLPLYGLTTHLAIGMTSALLILPALAPDADARRSRVLGLLGSRWMTWLGTISYGIYLWHIPVLFAVRGTTTPSPSPMQPLTTVGLLAVVLACSVLLATLSWYLVELPLQRAFRRRERAVVAAPAPALPTA